MRSDVLGGGGSKIIPKTRTLESKIGIREEGESENIGRFLWTFLNLKKKPSIGKKSS